MPVAPASLPNFEQGLLPALTYIIQEDIDRTSSSATSPVANLDPEFVPYAYQIISQLLELNSGTIPEFYSTFLTGILTPPPWQQKGSIPGLVRLIRAFLDKDAPRLVQTKQLEIILGIIQQRLIPSKMNDSWAFELLDGTVSNIPLYVFFTLLKGEPDW